MAGALLLTLLCAAPARADALRIATYNTDLERDGPGLLLRDILRGQDAQVDAVARVIAAAAPDIIALQGVDFDYHGLSLRAFRGRLAQSGWPMAHQFALPPNTGLPTGLDMDGDGRRGTPRDAQGYGHFAGQGGMAILSRHPILADKARDFSPLLWRDLPGALLPLKNGRPFPSAAAQAAQRLSSVGHWAVPVRVRDRDLWLLSYHAGPPVFDGPEDRNGRRNHDETRFWSLFLDGQFGAPPDGAFVLMGGTNTDPADGQGRAGALNTLLSDPRLRDPRPKGRGDTASDAAHTGDPALDTVDWPGPVPGNQRVDYVLPSAELAVRGAGVFWPAPGDPMAAPVEVASPHRLVWIDVEWP
ncbi:endonuclease/exonuclease/phosphatase family protein [Sediminimonas qiaohouensis]|uniref:endonuclease/exonuclease/phosphatase family protein n=1 Tax=Sediminimonas qiaohouensis TaxID=552061 RepID=UPI002353099B|nr:endonuclease/exonuclease/phosphatase family protein [Sediminimonas qiaohouensis]